MLSPENSGLIRETGSFHVLMGEKIIPLNLCFQILESLCLRLVGMILAGAWILKIARQTTMHHITSKQSEDGGPSYHRHSSIRHDECAGDHECMDTSKTAHVISAAGFLFADQSMFLLCSTAYVKIQSKIGLHVLLVNDKWTRWPRATCMRHEESPSS